MNKIYTCNQPVINIYKKPNLKSEVISQILYGEKFCAKNKTNGFLQGYSIHDRYQGYAKLNLFSHSDKKKTHKIKSKEASLYLKPNIKSKTAKKLLFNSKITLTQQQGQFIKEDKYWIQKKDTEQIKSSFNFLKNYKHFLHTKYLWGGNSIKGIDCSGLVQELMKSANLRCPRDSKDQQKFFKKKISINNIQKGDLLFWKGHVAIAISKTKLIHAFGPKKKVVIMTILQTINTIKKKSNLKLLSIKRP